MRLSIYSFNDLSRSYGIIQFEGSESGGLLNALRSLGLRGVRKVVSEVLGCNVKSLSLAFGDMFYEDRRYVMAYLKVELNDGETYLIEVYEDSASVISTEDALATRNVLINLISRLVPGVKLPKSFIVGI
ncbi:MAG: hypothetical protein B6U73_01785 [Desulfurococcales archaeon ex4484_204]|nr:MAG: hypothetical protein B6U73_01785 [Desulfurococcales archaeon ex4484_204]